MRRDVPAVLKHADAAVTLSTEQGFPFWAAAGMIYRGWALAMQGQGEEGLAQVRQGLAAYRATGAAAFVPFLSTWVAEVYDHLGHTEDGLQALVEAHPLMEQHEDRWWEAEVCRLRGVLLLRQTIPQQEEAEAWLQRALDVPPPGGEIARAAGGHEPEPAVAEPGPTRRCPRAAGTDLRLVH